MIDKKHDILNKSILNVTDRIKLYLTPFPVFVFTENFQLYSVFIFCKQHCCCFLLFLRFLSCHRFFVRCGVGCFLREPDLGQCISTMHHFNAKNSITPVILTQRFYWLTPSQSRAHASKPDWWSYFVRRGLKLFNQPPKDGATKSR